MFRRWDVRAMSLAAVLSAGLVAIAQERPERGRPSLADKLGQFGRSVVGGEAALPARSPATSGVQQAAYRGDDGSRVVTTAGEEAMPATPKGATRSSRRTAQREYQPGQREYQTGQKEPQAAPAGTPAAPKEFSRPARENAAKPTPAPAAAPRAASPGASNRGGRTLQDRITTSRRPPAAATAPDAAADDGLQPVPTDAPAEATPNRDEDSQPVRDASAPSRPTARTARANRPQIDDLPAGPSIGKSPDEMHVVHQSPLLGVETSGPRKIKVNEPAKYRVLARNVGQGAAQNVVVTVRLPEWADVVGSFTEQGIVRTPSQATSDSVEWHLDELSGNSHAEMSLEIVPRKSRPFDLAVQWTHSPVSTNAMVEVQEAKLLMALSGPDEVFFGETEVYKLTLSNPGTGDAENVVVRLLPSAPGDSNTASHNIGVIPAGHTKVVELELTARDPGRLMINAEATADGGLNANVAEEILVRRAELEVKLAGPKVQYAGAMGTYSVHVSNPGNAVAKNVDVTFLLPGGAVYVSDNSGGSLEAKGTKVVWRVPNLRPETTLRFDVKCKLETPGPNHPQAVCVAEGDVRDSSTLTTQVEALADLRLEVRDPQGPVPVGEDAEYEVHVINRGSKAAENVDVVAFFSEGVEPQSAEGEGHELAPGQVAFAPLALIGAGETAVLKVIARGQAPGNHMIRAQVRCQQLNTLLTQEETTLYYDAEGAEPAVQNPNAASQYQVEEDADWQPDPAGQTLPEETDTP